MKFFSTVFTMILFFLLTTGNLFAQGTIVIERINSKSLQGNFLGDTPSRTIFIYLPPNYEKNEHISYPVIYLLHGHTHNHTTWLADGKLNMDIKKTLDNLIAQGTIQPMIVVMPNAYNTYQGSWYVNSNVTGNWEDFIVKDLVSYIDNSYRTFAHRKGRGIAGHSMGGTGAFKIAMRHPGIYSSVFSLSAGFISFEHSLMTGKHKEGLIAATKETDAKSFSALEWEQRVAISCAAAFVPNKKHLPFYGDFPVDTNGMLIDTTWAKWLLHDAYTMINSYKDSLTRLEGIWIECGTGENLHKSNFKVSQRLDSAGITHTWEDYVGDHVNKIGQRVTDKMLPFFSKTLVTDLRTSNTSFPDKYVLYQNYPNPFNPKTAISYQLPVTSDVELSIFNLLGQKVVTLVDKKQTVGSYKVQWDATGFASGVYLYRLTTGEFSATRKLVLMK